MAMRPLRKGAVFQAVREQYGQKVARGQLLGYFTLLCIIAVLLMVLGGELLSNVAPASYAAAAPLIPLTAAAMVTPALFRTVNGNTSYPSKRKRTFQVLVILGAVLYVVGCLLLVGPIGYYSPPVAMFVAFALLLRLPVRPLPAQPGPHPVPVPPDADGAGRGGARGRRAYELLPTVNTWIELPIIAVFMFLYFVLLFRVRVIPRDALAGDLAHGALDRQWRPDRFNPRAGLRALDAGDRDHLHTAITARVSLEHLAGKTNGDRLAERRRRSAPGCPPGESWSASCATRASSGGLPVGGRTDYDALDRQVPVRRRPDRGAQRDDAQAAQRGRRVERPARARGHRGASGEGAADEAWEGGRASDTSTGCGAASCAGSARAPDGRGAGASVSPSPSA